ncbi:hypothetical protein BKA69DRAFT_667000 [Paraphysoderma sedebokerense]|nr:hypothetical protein BKA69DRAFT_667000 [Paraphysoderma sedebokerense]
MELDKLSGCRSGQQIASSSISHDSTSTESTSHPSKKESEERIDYERLGLVFSRILPTARCRPRTILGAQQPRFHDSTALLHHDTSIAVPAVSNAQSRQFPRPIERRKGGCIPSLRSLCCRVIVEKIDWIDRECFSDSGDLPWCPVGQMIFEVAKTMWRVLPFYVVEVLVSAYLCLDEAERNGGMSSDSSEELKTYTRLRIRRNLLDETKLSRISQIHFLTFLDLSKTNLSDASLMHLNKFRYLNYLNLSGNEDITDYGVSHLVRPHSINKENGLRSLKVLDLSKTRIGIVSVDKYLPSLPTLQVVNVSYTKVVWHNKLENWNKKPGFTFNWGENTQKNEDDKIIGAIAPEIYDLVRPCSTFQRSRIIDSFANPLYQYVMQDEMSDDVERWSLFYSKIERMAEIAERYDANEQLGSQKVVLYRDVGKTGAASVGTDTSIRNRSSAAVKPVRIVSKNSSMNDLLAQYDPFSSSIRSSDSTFIHPSIPPSDLGKSSARAPNPFARAMTKPLSSAKSKSNIHPPTSLHPLHSKQRKLDKPSFPFRSRGFNKSDVSLIRRSPTQGQPINKIRKPNPFLSSVNTSANSNIHENRLIKPYAVVNTLSSSKEDRQRRNDQGNETRSLSRNGLSLSDVLK